MHGRHCGTVTRRICPRERELLRSAELGDQPFEGLAQVSHGSLAGITLTIGADTRTQLGGSV
jgi:hypothetical protein